MTRHPVQSARNHLLVVFGCLTVLRLVGQSSSPCVIEWQKAFGGRADDYLATLQSDRRGGFMLAGNSNSGIDGSKTVPTYGGADWWVLWLDSTGEIVDQQTFGGTGHDEPSSIVELSDGSVILGGFSNSDTNGSKTSVNYGGFDYWVIRLDTNHCKLWEQTYGGSGNDYLRVLQQTADGGFVLLGDSGSSSNGNKTTPNIRWQDGWMVRLDSQGNKVWERTFGGTDDDYPCCLLQLEDGGFLVGGDSESPSDANKTSPNFGGRDYWIVRLDRDGNKLWDRSYGGSGYDSLQNLALANDGGFILAGHSNSGVEGNKTCASFGGFDAWVVRVDADGNELWDQVYGGSGYDSVRAVEPTMGGGFLIAGGSDSVPSGNKTSLSYGSFDAWLVALDSHGSKLWGTTFGGNNYDYVVSLRKTTDGAFVLGGSSTSGASGNKTEPAIGGFDYWMLKLAPFSSTSVLSLRPTPQSQDDICSNGFRFDLAGSSNSWFCIESSTELTDWTPIQTNRLTSRELQIIDPRATNAPWTFYRARLIQ